LLNSYEAATDIRNLGVRLGSFFAAERKSPSVRCVPVSASRASLFSVSYGEKRCS
jgi:hypothetical protein